MGYHTILSPKLMTYHHPNCFIILYYHNSNMAFDRSLFAGKFLPRDSSENVSFKQIFLSKPS